MTISHSERLLKKVAVVTGAGDGIGRGIARKLADHGANLALCELKSDTLTETKRLCEAAGSKVYSKAFDIRDFSKIQCFVIEAAKSLGGIDILINNAAVM